MIFRKLSLVILLVLFTSYAESFVSKASIMFMGHVQKWPSQLKLGFCLFDTFGVCKLAEKPRSARTCSRSFDLANIAKVVRPYLLVIVVQ